MAEPMKYWAFISYSHADEAWARWLHTSLETWRVPSRLVGRPLGNETVPSKLFPIFRDRDELPSSHELGAVINRALEGSRNLIVICSPRSATSRWVNEEISAFRALGRSERVFCLIVDGEPHASARQEIAFSECFPPALRTEGFEPIAADARPRKDGKDGAKLKLLAGILGIGLDELKQREKQRQRRDGLLRAAGALAVVAMLAGSWQWFATQRAAREQEIHVDQLVESGRQELLDARQARAAVYLAEALKLGRDTVPLRYMLARAMEAVDALTPVRFHHGGTVIRAAFSPDGKQIAMAVRIKDEVVGKIFDAATGAQVAVLKGLPQHPRQFRWFADGQRLYVSGFQRSVVEAYTEEEPFTGVWRTNAEQPQLVLRGPASRIGQPLDPDGVHLVAAGEHGGAEIWDAVQGKKVKTLAAGRALAACSLSNDGKSVLLADEGGKVEVWDVASGKLRASLTGAENLWVVGALFFPNGQQALVVTDSGDVRIWDLAKNSLRLAFLADPKTITEATLSADGRRLLTIGLDGYKVWSTARGLLALAVNRTLHPMATAALTQDGNFLYTADAESAVGEAWGVLPKTRLWTLDRHTAALNAVALGDGDGKVLTASADGDAEIWRTDVRPKWGLEITSADNPYAVAFAPGDDSVLIGGGTETHALLMRARNREPSGALEGPHAAVWETALTNDGRRLFTASDDGIARWWDTQTWKPLTALPLEAKPVKHDQGSFRRVARLNPDGSRALVVERYAYSSAGSHLPPTKVELLNPGAGKHVATLAIASPVYSAAFDPSGNRLVTGETGGDIDLWDANQGALLQKFVGHTAAVNSVSFSADGKNLVSSSDDGSVRLWEIASGSTLTAIGELGTPYDAVFSSSQNQVAIGTSEGVVWIYDIPNRAKRALKGHTGTVAWVRYTHDGKLLFSVGIDGSVRAWDAERAEELGKAAVSRFEPNAFDISRDEGRLAIFSRERYMGVWDVGLDTRAGAEISASLGCQVPWTLANGQLVSSPPPIRCEVR